jgi:membrane associated rhomboid family serine protease
MGIYDRDYYRKEGPSFLGSLATTGEVCKWLVIINVAVYILQCVTAPHGEVADAGFFTNAFAMDPVKTFSGFQLWRLVTAAFLHDPSSIFHLVWNMFFLWWLGHEMEELYGHREFLAFYLMAAIVGNALWGLMKVLNPPLQMVIGTHPYQALGASGAVTGVLVLYALNYPTRIIYFWFIPIPMWLIATIFVGKDVHALLRGMDDFGVAVACHVGGAAFALAYWQFEWRLAGIWSAFRGVKARVRSQPRLRIYREEAAAPVAALSSDPVDEQLEAKVDQVLEKLGRVGKDNLTPEEQEILKRASEVYRKRRT